MRVQLALSAVTGAMLHGPCGAKANWRTCGESVVKREGGKETAGQQGTAAVYTSL